MKRCRDCKHSGVFLGNVCYNYTYIDEAGEPEYYYTWANRRVESRCGSEAKGFEPSVLYKLKKLLK
jgi:hypothetical protein